MKTNNISSICKIIVIASYFSIPKSITDNYYYEIDGAYLVDDWWPNHANDRHNTWLGERLIAWKKKRNIEY